MSGFGVGGHLAVQVGCYNWNLSPVIYLPVFSGSFKLFQLSSDAVIQTKQYNITERDKDL